jgi:hypothetical protein
MELAETEWFYRRLSTLAIANTCRFVEFTAIFSMNAETVA